MNTHDAAWFGSGLEPSQFVCLISATILVFDYLCTLQQEVDLVWRRRLGNSATILFLLNRYIPYIYVFSVLEEYWLVAHSQEACKNRDIINAVIVTIGITTCELILALRTWAIWQLSRVILCILGAAACIKIPLILVAVCRVFEDVHYINISPTEIVCISPVIGSWSWETLVFTVILIVETLIAVLTLIKAVEARQSASRWYFKIHYMGIIYYFYNLLMTIVNVIGTVHFHTMGILSFALLQGVLQSVLCNRVIFLAREPSELVFGTTQTGTKFLSTRRDVVRQW
ncbi:hypothetical protein P691DRAFT_552493 [Macrolepiota fuliginosa MF-IS2]|uniref:DUF6533 domain-containing protein n=1 Tax=Macrolepiota fuliginosa MF-IS2 TaxID=1400762 RepID=A0A9P5XDM5_9AGAR|nr:hypothetical protein P691DRAFT_552493 [Macrolepiota fuliginosa MF-IS2]